MVGRSKPAAMLISAAAVVALGLDILAANSILPYPDKAIPAPKLGHFTMCQVPMWLQTQDRTVRWLGDCLGQLYSPPAELVVNRGTYLAIGCRHGACLLPPILRSSRPSVVRPSGVHAGAFYFEAVGPGSATIWATFTSSANCSLPSHGPQPDRCPAILLKVRGTP